MANCLTAGRNNGNPTMGLDERVAVEVKKVFDGCKSCYQNQSYTVKLDSVMPSGAIAPFTFISAAYSGNGAFDYTETMLECRNTRISGDLKIVVTVTFLDSTGKTFTGKGTLTYSRDTILKVPTKSITPYKFETTVNLTSHTGKFDSDTTVTFIGCTLIVTKVVMYVDILIPSYGFVIYPECEEVETEGCIEWADVPLFPSNC